MRYLFLYKEEYPWDVRVEKIIRSLTDAGHEVVLVCRNLEQAKVRETLDGFRVLRLPRTAGLPTFIRTLVNVALWFNPFWLWLVWRTAREFRPDVVLVRDLPLVLTGWIAGRATSARVLFDMAECYPEMYQSARKFNTDMPRRLSLKSPMLAKLYERVAVRLVDHILVTVEESRDRLLRMGISGAKITIVSNTPLRDALPTQSKVHHGKRLRVVYVGFLTRIRGLDVLIRGVRAFLDRSDEGVQVELDIIGKGAARRELENLVGELELGHHVRIHGWLEHAEVARLMSNANVGALTYRVCGHWNTTIPNKIFDYMGMGLPVLATGVGPIERIVRDTNCGLIAKDQDCDDVAAKLHELQDASLRQRLGDHGRAAVLDRWNWKHDEANLMSVLQGGSKV